MGKADKKDVVYRAEEYIGTDIGTSYMHREGWQVVAYDPNTQRRRCVFKNGRSPCHKMGWAAVHYKTGPSRAEQKRLDRMREKAEELARKLNSGEVTPRGMK